MTKYFRLIGLDGLPMFCSTEDDVPKGAVEVTRMPGPFEDFIDGAWVYNAGGHANQVAGPEHIAEAHSQKRIEALLIKSGIVLKAGLLVAEAGERKITLAAMADIVYAKASEFETAEVARQKASLKPS